MLSYYLLLLLLLFLCTENHISKCGECRHQHSDRVHPAREGGGPVHQEQGGVRSCRHDHWSEPEENHWNVSLSRTYDWYLNVVYYLNSLKLHVHVDVMSYNNDRFLFLGHKNLYHIQLMIKWQRITHLDIFNRIFLTKTTMFESLPVYQKKITLLSIWFITNG